MAVTSLLIPRVSDSNLPLLSYIVGGLLLGIFFSLPTDNSVANVSQSISVVIILALLFITVFLFIDPVSLSNFGASKFLDIVGSKSKWIQARLRFVKVTSTALVSKSPFLRDVRNKFWALFFFLGEVGFFILLSISGKLGPLLEAFDLVTSLGNVSAEVLFITLILVGGIFIVFIIQSVDYFRQLRLVGEYYTWIHNIRVKQANPHLSLLQRIEKNLQLKNWKAVETDLGQRKALMQHYQTLVLPKYLIPLDVFQTSTLIGFHLRLSAGKNRDFEGRRGDLQKLEFLGFDFRFYHNPEDPQWALFEFGQMIEDYITLFGVMQEAIRIEIKNKFIDAKRGLSSSELELLVEACLYNWFEIPKTPNNLKEAYQKYKEEFNRIKESISEKIGEILLKTKKLEDKARELEKKFPNIRSQIEYFCSPFYNEYSIRN